MIMSQRDRRMERVRPKPSSGAQRYGQAMVEAAFSIIVLILISMGFIQYGFLYNATITLSHITRSGSRFAGVHGAENQINYNGSLTPPDAAIRNFIRDTSRSTSIPL